jgi:hypothetical protein
VDQLRDFYRFYLKWLAGAIVAVAFAYRGVLNTLELDPTTSTARLLRSSESILVALLFLAGEWAIRTRLWRVVKCQRDYSGEWTATTTYTRVEVGSPSVPAGPVSRAASHSVTIDQDCFSIAIKPTAGAFNNWYSIAMSVLSDDQIGYVYHVNYIQPNVGFPSEAKGYEEMTVVERQAGGWLKGRPTKLTGVFFHCAQGMVPVYSGTVVFERVAKKATLMSVLRGA